MVLGVIWLSWRTWSRRPLAARRRTSARLRRGSTGRRRRDLGRLDSRNGRLDLGDRLFGDLVDLGAPTELVSLAETSIAIPGVTSTPTAA